MHLPHLVNIDESMCALYFVLCDETNIFCILCMYVCGQARSGVSSKVLIQSSSINCFHYNSNMYGIHGFHGYIYVLPRVCD